jgi:hypothetical protein
VNRSAVDIPEAKSGANAADNDFFLFACLASEWILQRIIYRYCRFGHG